MHLAKQTDNSCTHSKEIKRKCPPWHTPLDTDTDVTFLYLTLIVWCEYQYTKILINKPSTPLLDYFKNSLSWFTRSNALVASIEVMYMVEFCLIKLCKILLCEKILALWTEHLPMACLFALFTSPNVFHNWYQHNADHRVMQDSRAKTPVKQNITRTHSVLRASLI